MRPCRCCEPLWPDIALSSPFLAFTASVSFGRILFRSPTIAEVGEFEDRRVGVLVDRDDVLRALHPDLVLDRAGDARREVQLRRDRLAGLADLRRVGVPAGVDHRARGGDGALPPNAAGELLGQLEALGLAEAATAGDEDVGALDVDVGAALFAARDHRRLLGLRAQLEAELLHGGVAGAGLA